MKPRIYIERLLLGGCLVALGLMCFYLLALNEASARIDAAAISGTVFFVGGVILIGFSRG